MVVKHGGTSHTVSLYYYHSLTTVMSLLSAEEGVQCTLLSLLLLLYGVSGKNAGSVQVQYKLKNLLISEY